MKFKTLYIIFLFFCAALVGAGFGFMKVYEQRQERYTITLPEATAFPQVNAKIYDYLNNSTNGSLALVGNIAFDDSILLNSYDATWKQFQCEDMLSNLSSYLTHQGCLVGSMNGTFAGEGKGRESRAEFGYGGRKYYNAPDDFAEMLGSYGFDMLAMANYHAYDSNYTGLVTTRKTIVRNSIVPVGIFEEEDDVCEYETTDIGGISAGIFSYTESLKFKPGSDNDFCVNQLFRYDEEHLKELCTAVKKSKRLGIEVAVVYIYFSDCSTGRVSEKQRNVVQQLFDAGADVVVGTNPDIIEPMEIQQTRTKDGHTKYQVALYSLGNFITGETGRVGSVSRNTGMIAQFTYDQDSTGTYLSSLAFLPTYCVSYPTVEEQEEAGAHVRVLPIPEVYEYMAGGGSTKSHVKSTKPTVKKDQNGASQKNEYSSDSQGTENTTEHADTEKQSITTEPDTETPVATEAAPEDVLPGNTTQAAPMDGAKEEPDDNLLLSLLGIQKVQAKDKFYQKRFGGSGEDTMENNEEYTYNLTKNDFSYIRTAQKNAIDRLFYGTNYKYSYKNGWFYVKNLKK